MGSIPYRVTGLVRHNEQVVGSTEPSLEMKTGTICVLLRDGRLFGPFASTDAARYWCVSQDLIGFSTYDLLPPF